MRVILSFLFALTFSGVCSAQYASIGFRLGMGTYSMSDLSDIQDVRVASTSLPLKTTENYPPSPVYRIELVSITGKFISKWGVFYTFNSTGARSTLSDYSGKIYLDAIVNGQQTGITLEHQLLAKDKMAFGAYLDMSYIMSNLKLTDYLAFTPTSSYIHNETINFKSNGLCFEPGIFFHYIIFKHLGVRTNLGVLIDFPGDLHASDNKDLKLQSGHNIAQTQWTGIRVGFQIDI